MNGWRGQSRKKIGNDVTYVLKGQQIARSKAANIANPRTASQMTQRIKMSNVVAMYRANSGWMNRYAFENKKQKWSVFNAFVSANLSGSLVALTKQEAAAGACVAAPYKMTDGSLPQIQINRLADDGVYATDLYIGTLEIGGTTTIGDLSAALIANNNGIVQGMQISLIENAQQVVNNIPRVVVRAYEFIVNSTDTTPLTDKWGSAGLTTYTGGTSNAIAYDTMTGESAFTFILSHTYGGKTHVGASYMVLNDPAVYDSYTSSTAVALAIQSYGSADTTPFLDSTEAGGPSDGGTNPDVPFQANILGVQIGGAGSLIAPGRYAGAFVSESNWVIAVKMSKSIPAGATASVEIYGQGADGTSETEDVTISGDTITAHWDEAPYNPNYPLAEVTVYINGVSANAEFATTDPGVTE